MPQSRTYRNQSTNWIKGRILLGNQDVEGTVIGRRSHGYYCMNASNIPKYVKYIL